MSMVKITAQNRDNSACHVGLENNRFFDQS
jgi:hypothetical protein